MGFESKNVAKSLFIYISLIISAFITLLILHLEPHQIIAALIILGIIFGTVLFWEIRLAFALIGIAILISSNLLSIENFVKYSLLNIIAFLAGMMIFVAYLERKHFFEYLIAKLILIIGGGRKLFVALMIASAFFAALVDEVTSIIFMTTLILLVTSKINVNPVPFIIMIIFATNIGSSATAVGNPVGVMIALQAKLSFTDFARWATPISFTALLACISLCTVLFKKEVEEFAKKTREIQINEILSEQLNGKNMLGEMIFFSIVMLSLIFHHQTEEILGIEKNAMLLGTALFAGGIVLILEADNARRFVEHKVDWWTLLFFILLFSAVGALEDTGIIELISSGLIKIFGDSKLVSLLGITLTSGLLSAVLDNVLAVAIFLPIIEALQTSTVAGEYLWWALLFGGTFFGNLTTVGSTANIVAISLMEKQNRKFKVSFLSWLKYSIPIVVITTLIAIMLVYAQIPFMPK